jgi:hypothetical protein
MDNRDPGEYGWIERLRFVEHGAQQARSLGTGHKAQREAEECRPHSIHQHQPQHLFALSTKGDADADFAGALRDDVGEYAKESDRG